MFGSVLATAQKKTVVSYPVTGANNGVSLNGTTVVLGQDATGLTGVAALSNNRNIPAGRFTLSLYTDNAGGGLVGGGFAVRSSLTGATGNLFVVNNVSISGATSNNATRTNASFTPSFRISGGTNYTYNTVLSQPDFRPTGGTGYMHAYNAIPSIVNASGDTDYVAVAYNASPFISNNLATNLGLRGFFYAVRSAFLTPPAYEVAFENSQGDNFFNSDVFGLGNPGRTKVGSAFFNTAAQFEVEGSISAGDPGSGFAEWKLGGVIAGAVALDNANYVEVEINGVPVKLLIAS
jgi:hypothetical protein